MTVLLTVLLLSIAPEPLYSVAELIDGQRVQREEMREQREQYSRTDGRLTA